MFVIFFGMGYLVLLLDGVAADGRRGLGGFRGGRVDGLLPNLEGMSKGASCESCKRYDADLQ